MKLYDFDGMFDEKLSAYITKNAGKYKEEEWEDIIPEMYAKFGNTVIKSIGKTPNEYYAEMSDEELIKTLKGHLKQNIPVSEYLCNAIESRKNDNLLLPLLDGTEDEVGYALNLLGTSKEAVNKFMDILVTSNDEEICNTCVDKVKERADEVKDRALENYNKGVKCEYMLEILSRCVIQDDAIYEILCEAFRSDDENICMHASYLASYGDERALDMLLDKIDEEDISYVEYQELKYAIEALGGSYDKPRDFTSDPYYEMIKGQSSPDIDIFKNIKN